jgi:hypothetical protein
VLKPLRAALGPRAHLLSRLRVNAALYAPPTPTPGAPGRPRKYGARLGNAAQLATTLRGEARAYTLNLYGGMREVMAVDRLVILKTLRCQVRVVWVFRKTQWIALVTTDLTLTVAQIVEYYGARWKIDIDQPYCLHKAVIRTWKGMLAHRYVGGWPSRVVPCGVRAGVRIPARRPTPASGCARPGGPGGRAPSPYESN